MLGHDTGAPSEQHPRKQAADQRIADADPGGSDAEVPAELARVADEYNRVGMISEARKSLILLGF